ncbi:MAG: hypothetical protein R2694_01745 [Ilumatobacteraceae bacterium]|nr:hypothetical protein [Ilumatobacter sp.]MCB0983816.1 hypothetical protein [Ilumatobacter sp.]
MSLQRMQVLITAEQRAWLERESIARGTPCTAIVRDALDAARGVRPAPLRLAAFERLAALPARPAPSWEEMEAAADGRYRAVPE